MSTRPGTTGDRYDGPASGAAGRGRVAVIGLGRMGAAMAGRLADQGFTVGVHNRSADKARAVGAEIGAEVLATPAEAAAWVVGGAGDTGAGTGSGTDSGAVILLSLADDAACRAVYEGGLIAALGPGIVVVDTSTISPALARELAAAVAATGAAMLDAPVSGSVPAAQTGGLTVMAGGAESAVAAARPVLETIAKRVVPVGPSGSGAVVKLAINSILHTFNQALSEAIVLAEHAGVDRSVFYGVVAESAVAAPFVGYKQDAFVAPGTAPVAFSVELMAKDLRLALELADSVGTSMPGAAAAAEVAADAISHGLGDADMSAIAGYLRAISRD